jgi:hypothetical protein
MDSAMAAAIVNDLNGILKLHLPANTCHVHIDLLSLTNVVLTNLGLVDTYTSTTASLESVVGRVKEDIAIVGQAFRLPGDINDVDSLWEALVTKRTDIMTPVPPDRWDHDSFYRSPESTNIQPCDITFQKAGFIDSTSFDNSFFGISAAEAICVSPAIRLTLEIAFEALENANIPSSRLKGTNTAVFTATSPDEGYQSSLFWDQGWGGTSSPWSKLIL